MQGNNRFVRPAIRFPQRNIPEQLAHEEVARAYRNHRNIDARVQKLDEPCEFKCRMEMYCQTVSNDYDEHQFCKDEGKFAPFDLDATLLSFETLIDQTWYTVSKPFSSK